MYGENTGQLRAELTTLLRQHRIQQRLGGKGIHTVPETTTVAEREELGHQIARFRRTVLVWCHQAVNATSPTADLEGTSLRTRQPVEELRYRLATAIEASSAGTTSLDELTASQGFPIVETWRLAAKAAALGEHDFGAGVGYVQLNDDQCLTVLKDAAEVVRALVALDRRYEGIPGWERLKEQGRLGRAAEVCAASSGYGEPNYTVDLRGWRPPPKLTRDPVLPGLHGILQGEHNLLVTLKNFPNAHSMRVVLESQLIVSRELATRARDVDPELAEKWQQRAETYTLLIHETRDVRGLLGNGGAAAGQAAMVAARSQSLDLDPAIDSTPLRQLDRLFTRIDARLAEVIERGTSQHLYLLRVKLPRLSDQSEGLIQPARTRYIPIDSRVQNALIPIVRSRLRPQPEPPRAPNDAGRSRSAFEAAITHRPTPRGATPDVPSL